MRKTTFALVMCLLVALLTGQGALAVPWDGYSGDEGERVCIVDMNDLGTMIDAGIAVSSQYTKTARYSGLWENHPSHQELIFNGVPKDWSGYTILEVAIYSPKEVPGAAFSLIAFTEQQTTAGPSYFMSSVQSGNWTGWKEFKLYLADFTSSRGAAWDKVTYFELAAGGWTMTPQPDTQLYIDSVYLGNEELDGSTGYSDYSKGIGDEVMEQGIAVYDDRSVALVNNELVPLVENRQAAVYRADDIVYVPAETIGKMQDIEFTNNGDGSFVLQRGESVLSFAVGSADYTLGESSGHFPVSAVCKENVAYVPFEACMQALGMQIFTHRKLTVAVPEESVLRLQEDIESAEYIAQRLTYDKKGPKSFTDEDFEAVRQRWIQYAVGDENNDLSDPYVARAIQGIENSALASWELAEKYKDLGNDPFTGKVPTTSPEITTMCTHLRQLAYGYATYGASMYHDETWRKTILELMEQVCSNYFSAKELTDQAVVGVNTGNWYDWQIGGPQNLIEAMLIMADDLTPAQCKNYLIIPDTLVPTPRGTSSNRTNFALNCIGAAVLQKDAERLIHARDAVNSTFLYVNQNTLDGSDLEETDGMYRDGSFLMHYRVPYHGGYGVTNYARTGLLLAILQDTAFEVTNPSTDNLIEFLFTGMDSMMYNGNMLDMVRGRGVVSSTEHAAGIGLIQGMLRALDYADEEDQPRIKAKIKQYVTESGMDDQYTSLTIREATALRDIMTDESIVAAQSEDVFTVHHNMDRAILKRDDFALGISMSSSRVYNYEAFWGENVKGWYGSDGMVYTYTDDLFSYGPTFWNSVNPYRIPGTTVEARTRQAIDIPDSADSYLSSKDFVGGVSDGRNGAAAMWLESYHNDGTNGYDVFECDLEAKKSWFMLEDKMVALGAGINATDDYEVETTVENRKSNSTVLLQNNDSERYEIEAVTASDEPQPENPIAAAVDGNLVTRWSAEGDQWLQLDLGEVKTVGHIKIAFMSGSARKTMFDLQVSTDGQSWTQVYSGESGGETDSLEAFSLKNSPARYVRFVGHGNTVNAWNSVTEVEIYGPSASGLDLFESVYTGQEKIVVDGAQVDVTDEVNQMEAQWVWAEGASGYYFPGKQAVNMRKTTSNPSFFELWINHGKQPKDASYAYVQLPGKSLEETMDYAQNPTVEILSNTPALQAVRDTSLSMTQAVFWEAGSLEKYTVSAPMMLMETEKGDSLSLSFSDPSQKLTNATIEIAGVYIGSSEDPAVSIAAEGGKTIIYINYEKSYGKSFTVNLTAN